MSLSLDRQTMANVLLQKQAEPASALLPQWLSGYAFLFTMETNIDRAKEIRATLPANMAAGAEPLRLRVNAPGDLAKLLGERVAVNAREAAILVQVVNRPGTRSANSASTASSDPATGMHLFSWHYSSLSPKVELESMAAERTEALVAKFKEEVAQRGEESPHQPKTIAEATLTERVGILLARRNADQSLYVRDAVGTAQEHGLDYVEFVNY